VAPSIKEDADVIIVGAGPVGLFLACCLQHKQIRCKVLERRQAPVRHSLSIGIHPVSLELLARLGIVEELLAQGQRIRQGHAYVDRTHIGTIDFSLCPAPFQFVLALPQDLTEAILEDHLRALDATALLRETEVSACTDHGDAVSVHYRTAGAGAKSLRAKFLIGCDGSHSTVRDAAGIGFTGIDYPDTYAMGDFSDTMDDPADAAIYLHRRGLVESFPLPGRRRRWVVKTESNRQSYTASAIALLVEDRTGHCLNADRNFMVSRFGVQSYFAERFVKGRIALAGDAAHIVSPIGGQGMNLGWLNAWILAQSLDTAVRGKRGANALEHYAKRSIKAARKARRRAAFNMRLGRKTNHPWLRKLTVHMLVNTPLRYAMARLFTMRGITSIS
jgi:2-polyprenyl-6-methoxyphenol hydroxylase-like FAD-dependent oxidoreductase